jgi:hypothetical protein
MNAILDERNGLTTHIGIDVPASASAPAPATALVNEKRGRSLSSIGSSLGLS